MRHFDTGATRDVEEGKLDYEGFLSPVVLRRFAEYMHVHRVQSDGAVRDSDNWQKGIPKDTYIKSGFRHFLDWWLEHRGYPSREGLEDALCALMFNTMGYLYEILEEEKDGSVREGTGETSEGDSDWHSKLEGSNKWPKHCDKCREESPFISYTDRGGDRHFICEKCYEGADGEG